MTDYTRELCAAEADLTRAAALMETASLPEVEQASRELQTAIQRLLGIPEIASGSENDRLRSAVCTLNALMQNAVGFYSGWISLAALTPAAYTRTGATELLRLAGTLSCNG
jgi:hypothetical protein